VWIWMCQDGEGGDGQGEERCQEGEFHDGQSLDCYCID
jgi:hypothetical protein